MNRKATILWRSVVMALFVGMVPLGAYVVEQNGYVDTAPMLDVSVSIRTLSHVTIDNFGDSVWKTNSGSGFLVSRHRCEVWTNHHVIAGAALIEIYPRNWNKASGIPARVINSTPRTDVAILKLDQCKGIAEARLGDSDSLQPGDETFAVGNPLGRNPDSISRGIISHTERYRASNIPYLQTDAAINPGNSGGALFDHEGRVVGINTAIETTRFGASTGVGFAVPINLVKQVIAELRDGHPSWGDAGISSIVSNLSVDEAEVFDLPAGAAALVVTRTPDVGPSVGKLRVHDVIYRINNEWVVDSAQAIRFIGRQRVGETLTFGVLREGEHLDVDIQLAEGWKADKTPGADIYEGHLGLSLEMWAGKEGDLGQFDKPVITKVHSLGPAHKAHISSSQKSIMVRGQFVVPYLLDVKTITGVAFQGLFHAVDSVEEIENFAAMAYEEKLPLLLEIELWARKNPKDVNAKLQLKGTEFFKLIPRLAYDVLPATNPLGVARIAELKATRPISRY
ncbi:MAG: trypsin-like peptidase domain-containing protein [Pseudomonadota bacterium]